MVSAASGSRGHVAWQRNPNHGVGGGLLHPLTKVGREGGRGAEFWFKTNDSNHVSITTAWREREINDKK